jgi:outer membrane protein TolC
VKKSGRRSKKLRAVAAATSLVLVSGTLPASLAFAQGTEKKGVPTAKEAADAGTRAPEEVSGGRRIGLREALKLAVRQNPTLANETIDVAIAEAQIRQTYGLEDWLVAAGATWVSQRANVVEGKQFQTPAVDSLNLTASVARPLIDGGKLGLTATNGWTKADNRLEIQPTDMFGNPVGDPVVTSGSNTEYNPKLQLTFNQPLLAGFGEVSYGAARARARANRTVQEMEREGTASNVVRDVVQAYWELAYAAQEVEIRKASLALAREQLRITQAGIDVGKLAKTESLAIEQAIASREQELLLAEQNRSERAIEVRRLIGMEIGPGEIELNAVDRLDTAAIEPDLDKTLKAAMDNNPQLRTVRAQGKAAVVEVEVTENGLLPQLNFDAAAGPQGNSDTFGDAVSKMAKFDAYEVRATLNFSMALGNDAARGAHDVARGNVRKAKLSEADISSQIAAQVVRAVNLVKFAKKRMEVAAKATRLAAQNVDLEKARWEVGRTTNFEVLKRQDELAQSQLAEARARADYLKSVSVLDSLTGDILPRYGIELAKK